MSTLMGSEETTTRASQEQLRRRAMAWAVRLCVKPKNVRVQPMSRKWGSCSTGGTITLATDLANQEPVFQDFVIVYELLHLRLPNHGRASLNAMLSAYVPGWRSFKSGHLVQPSKGAP